MQQDSLQKGLLPRHLRMMAIGGMIGAGMFKGSAETVALAGPGVVLAYLFGGALMLIVMAALAEMAGVFPKSDIRDLIARAFGTRAAFVVGWLYWINWVLVMAVEIVAAGSFLQFWFASAPLWVLSSLVALVIIFINLLHVKYYGEMEFWLASIKVATLLVFIALGGAMMFGAFSAEPAPYFTHYTAHGGFFPQGMSGVFASLLVVMFSYGGAELIGITIAETKDADKVLPKVIKGVIGRVVVFYTLPLLVICGLMPWNEIAQKGSPFVQVLSSAGLSSAAHVMNFIMLTAVFSAANSGMYATSRMLYSLAKGGEAPRAFLTLSKNGVPILGLIVSACSLFIGALVAYATPENVFNYLMGIPGFTVMLVWISICLAQLKLRPQYPDMPGFTVVLFPYTTWFAMLALCGIFISIVCNPANLISTLICVGTMVILFICARFKLV
ncbi:amino acid/polyamine/organocation transporter (APC superfamily) [Aneurinibacillus soli]|uniref:GABA permease n=1 Tax=Aneurinibacillus soli TaxID=1500254 RepID=A0A0U5C7P3_9BACL|nr:amino acid permease [Aneurinibacillus soli]PYE64310.1 amino acid/polyamine/organocation transporter (APC superfamily) [Aneurinibacillus soli]BAU28259.1 GABA permease [Aneurinibacillus soli]